MLYALVVAAALATPDPIREVVYKVSYTHRLDANQEIFGGQVMDDMGKMHQNPPFNSKEGVGSDSGTITVDVMQVAGDTLGIRLTEHWNGSTPSSTYLGNVGADGSVNFSNPQVTDVSRTILGFFSPAFLGGRYVDKGVTWTQTASGSGLNVTSTYVIGEVDGSIAAVDETTTIKSSSVRDMDTLTTGSITYKPTKLVPIAGRIQSLAYRSDAESSTDVTSIVNFERLSDTLDTSP
ncbi:MAG TPA: hypothetical protein VJN22_06075 [Candidatus Eremiobacteraceae bacterium]|nr:hypothetical protein [Candidatus Eremiobacteraceae bacterium]